MSQATPELIDAVKAKAVDGRVTCPVLRKLAEEMGVTVRAVGDAANEAGIKIKNCELGCF
jgi:hypothetical protein